MVVAGSDRDPDLHGYLADAAPQELLRGKETCLNILMDTSAQFFVNINLLISYLMALHLLRENIFYTKVCCEGFEGVVQPNNYYEVAGQARL